LADAESQVELLDHLEKLQDHPKSIQRLSKRSQDVLRLNGGSQLKYADGVLS
jgi:hypothetical protein